MARKDIEISWEATSIILLNEHDVPIHFHSKYLYLCSQMNFVSAFARNSSLCTWRQFLQSLKTEQCAGNKEVLNARSHMGHLHARLKDHWRRGSRMDVRETVVVACCGMPLLDTALLLLLKPQTLWLHTYNLQNISPFTLHYFRQKLKTMLICEHTYKYLEQKLIGASRPFSKQGWWS